MAYFYEGKSLRGARESRARRDGKTRKIIWHNLLLRVHAQPKARAWEWDPVTTGFPPEVATKIREHLLKAIELRPDYPESYNPPRVRECGNGRGSLMEAIASMKRVLSISPGRMIS
jgi:hypothetical protein